MVQARFGDTLAYHGGGTDLRFPHHQAEILQSEAAFERPLAHRWVHHGSVHDAMGRKMSKSLGNTVSLAQALDRARDALPGQGDLVAGAAVRLALLSALWTKPLDWSDTLIDTAAQHLTDWAEVAQAGTGSRPGELLAILANNLNTPRALAWLHARAKAAKAGDLGAAADLHDAMSLLGLVLPAHAVEPVETSVPDEVQRMIEARSLLREQRDWAGADRVRDAVEALGWRVVDGADGARATRVMPEPSTGHATARRLK